MTTGGWGNNNMSSNQGHIDQFFQTVKREGTGYTGGMYKGVSKVMMGSDPGADEDDLRKLALGRAEK